MENKSEKVLVNPVIRLDARDNVVVARADIPTGVSVLEENITILEPVPAGHKIATVHIKKGEPILKYNTIIGFAAEDLVPGTRLHKHNIEFQAYDRDYAFSKDYEPVEYIPESERATFQGIVREDGKVGTRNYIGIIILSNCAATVAQQISRHYTPEVLAAYPNVDGVVPFIHSKGCGGDSTPEFVAQLRRTLSGYCRNPNIAGMIVVGLGCERNDLAGFMADEKLERGPKLQTLIMQEIGGTTKTVAAGIKIIDQMLPEANKVKRETVSASHLMVGLQCGGSDGFSGVTANPALGMAMDILVRNGGTAILSETTEVYGLEHTLTRRAVTPEVGQKLVDRMNWWLEQCAGRNTQIMGKVSPGNDAGGLANVFEKSLGGVKKGGSTPLMEVYKYAEPVTQKGFVFMDSPGFDPASITGQIAGGANLIAFTTGRGSCFGSVPSPCLKLASNTPMYNFMETDMDVNCGQVVDGDKTLEEMGQEVFDHLLRIASGEKTKSEELGVGTVEFVPWDLLLLG